MGERLARRVLFIGNSYTEGLRSALVHLVPPSLQYSTLIEFVTKGGKNLTWHWQHDDLKQKIAQGHWDYVVLQEQSQTPTLQGQLPYQGFVKVVGDFCQLIRDANAVPVLFMTWGARRGDRQHLKVSPDYWAMQDHLARAYREMARLNHTELVPVGEAWAQVRLKAPQLADKCYQKDGHHPSAVGNYLSASMFCRYLWQFNSLHLDTVKLSLMEKAIMQAAIDSTFKLERSTV